MKNIPWIEILIIGCIVGLLLLTPGIWVGKSYLEAKAFNEVTGKHVTTWQAMWIELRVQESGK